MNQYRIDGVKLAAASAGIKTSGKTDLVLIALDEGSTVAGVFTQNAFCAAPVTVAKQHLKAAPTRYFIINSGNANCGTGEQGFEAALASCQALADASGSTKEAVLPFSTGVIGEPLDYSKIQKAAPSLYQALNEDAWPLAATGIMTTDTQPKLLSVDIVLSTGSVRLTGICKGAGMIKPGMATMLAYMATDATIEPSLLQRLVSAAAEQSFNRVTVDGDTSTNDACMLAATGKAAQVREGSHDEQVFSAALNQLSLALAQLIIRDGEGATKFVEVKVDGGLSSKECLAVAYTVAESPLVKTALFASDPNWGRILAAVGRADITALDINKLNISINGVSIVEAGQRSALYTEAAGQEAMNPSDILIHIELKRGQSSESVWTTDFSHDYVTINAEYRT